MKAVLFTCIIPEAIFPRLGEDMRSVNGFFLFDLGQIWQLSRLLPSTEIKSSLPIIGACLYVLRLFVGHPDNQNDLPSSVYEAEQLINYLDAMSQRPADKITDNDHVFIGHTFTRLRTLLNDELGKRFTFFVEEKRGFNSATLWRTPTKLFSADSVPLLSDFVKINLDEAAKCLLLDRYTAVGFHVSRSAECAARKYYELVTNRRFDDPTFRTFGKIAQELKDKYESLSSAHSLSGELGIVISNLISLCKVYRNDIAHPEIMELKEDQAVDALNHTITAISTMIRDVQAGGSHFVKAWAPGDLF